MYKIAVELVQLDATSASAVEAERNIRIQRAQDLMHAAHLLRTQV